MRETHVRTRKGAPRQASAGRGRRPSPARGPAATTTTPPTTGGSRRTLAVGEPDPERAENELEQGEDRHLRRRDQARPDREERKARAHLHDPERREDRPVALARRAQREQTAGTRGRRAPAKRTSRASSRRRGGDGRSRSPPRTTRRRGTAATTARVPASNDPTAITTDADGGEREGHPGPAVDPLPQEHPAEQRRHHRRGRLHEEDVGDRRVVQREHEPARRDRHRDGERDPGATHRAERRDGAALARSRSRPREAPGWRTRPGRRPGSPRSRRARAARDPPATRRPRRRGSRAAPGGHGAGRARPSPSQSTMPVRRLGRTSPGGRRVRHRSSTFEGRMQ